MFNDLNPNSQSVPPKPVDDIFADTDKTVEAKKTSAYYPGDSEIEATKVGVLSSPETEEPSSKNKIIKIAIIILLVILLIALGYLAYAKFFSNKGSEQVENLNAQNQQPVATVTPTVITETPVEPVVVPPVSQEVEIIPSLPAPTTTPPVSTIVDSDTDGLADDEEIVLGTNVSLIDTDSDGLTDYEEVKNYSTNPLLADTDNDGLSDYEEVKIYKTNPVNSDTDGDTYKDGAEVKSGYDPLAVGKKLGE